MALTIRPLPYTLLSPMRYAEIMEINPVHFSGAYGSVVWPIDNNACQDVWVRSGYQFADMVSRESIIRTILDAENDIANLLGYHLSPRWVSDEMHSFPRFHRPEYRRSGGLGVSGKRVGVTTNWKKVVAQGRRATSLIGVATVDDVTLVYSDEDADGFAETATITLPTTLTDFQEIKAYFSGYGGMQEWEIRPARKKTISGGNVVLVFDSWLFIKPELQAGPQVNTNEFVAINIDTTVNYITEIEIHREYTDNSQPSAQFFWEPNQAVGSLPFDFCSSCNGAGCAACSQSTQDGCLVIRDVDSGSVAPAPGTWDADNERWTQALFAERTDPTQVKIWYYAGEVDEYYRRGISYDPLSEYWAQTIAWLATARLERSFCSCGNAAALAEHLRTDIAFSGNDTSYMVDFAVLSNPLGTKVGELWAWNRVSKMKKRIIDGAVI